MTKVSKRIVKCANCGAESEQLFVYSVNYLLGDRKANDDLMNHKQKCPNCGYEAADISVDISLEKKYDVDPEENIPYEVYGIPKASQVKPIFDNNIPKVIKEEVVIFIGNEKIAYQLEVCHYFTSDRYEIVFGQDKPSLPVIISREEYQRFMENFYTLTNQWKNEYIKNDEEILSQNNKINWNILITNPNEVRMLHGKNDFPSNWNDFIDLLITGEKLYKKRKYKDE